MHHRNVLHRSGVRAARRGRAAYDRVIHQHGGTIHQEIPIEEALPASELYCQEIARREARNFYWGFVALPKRQRTAIYALYSFSREVDDGVDLQTGMVPDAAARAEIARRLALQSKRVDDCYDSNPHDPVIHVLCDVVKRYGIPREELSGLIRGVELDIQRTRYPTWRELEVYCRLVASCVGRMCTRIFGYNDPIALEYAGDLGIALQITNILRDVREDFDLGRIYLPVKELERFGVAETELGGLDTPRHWKELIEFEIERADRYFETGLKVTEYIPRRAAACVLTMAGIYQTLLRQIAEDPYLPLSRRAHLRKRTKIKVMLGSWLKAV